MTDNPPTTVGELSLSNLLSSLNPILEEETYVFITLPLDTIPPPNLEARMSFREREGTTLIATKESAIAHDLLYTFPCRMITLDVHSSLEAVGFMACITQELAKLRIGVNPVSGYFHDHIFVPEGREGEVMAALVGLRDKSRGGMLASFVVGGFTDHVQRISSCSPRASQHEHRLSEIICLTGH